MVGCDESAPRCEVDPPGCAGGVSASNLVPRDPDSTRCDARVASPTPARAGVDRRLDPRGYHPAAAGRAVFHLLIRARSGEQFHCGEQVHCNASDTRDIVPIRNRRSAIEVVNVNRVRGKLVESLVEEAVRWASESVDLVDEKTAPAWAPLVDSSSGSFLARRAGS